MQYEPYRTFIGMNTWGRALRITSFGESHGLGVGVVMDGLPAGLAVDLAAIQTELDRRKPGTNLLASQRREGDQVQVLSGLFECATTGAPLTLYIANEDAKPQDYDALRGLYRPSHADFTYQAKYGARDHRGGGRSSARVTAGWVAAGAVARQLLAPDGVLVEAWTEQIGPERLANPTYAPDADGLTLRWDNFLRVPEPDAVPRMEAAIDAVRRAGDTLGGIIAGRITGLPAGLGEPLFDKLHARLAQAMLTINAAKGFEYGAGFAAAAAKGSELNDAFYQDEQGRVRTATNNSGGIQGGISNGEPVTFRVAFKPVATLLRPQALLGEDGDQHQVAARGRHDPCVVPRAVPIVEAMACLVAADFWMMARLGKPLV